MIKHLLRSGAALSLLLTLVLGFSGTSDAGNCLQCPWKRQHHKKECFPTGPCWGYYPTCWRAWPLECAACPPPDRVVWPHAAEELPPTPKEELPALPAEDAAPVASPSDSAESSAAPAPLRLRLERDRRATTADHQEPPPSAERGRSPSGPVVRSSRQSVATDQSPAIERERPSRRRAGERDAREPALLQR